MLSILIPARNEFLLKPTIESVLSAARGDIEIIAVLDGYWPEPNIIDDPRVTLIHHTNPIGQRAAINEAARIAKGKYILKTDGHSIFDEGFDIKLAEDCEYDWTVLPRMYNLHAFDWVCPDGHRFYQDKFPPEGGKCKDCSKPVKIEMVWKPRLHRKTDYMSFNKDLVVRYWKKFEERPEGQGDITDVMNGVGACWFMHKDRFWELGGMDEKHGSWGQVGVEVALKAWLSGGRHVVNKKTWYAHMFRTTGEFGFPYKISGKSQDRAREYSRDLWMNDKWPLQKKSFNWLLNKFHPVPSWPKKKPEIIEMPQKVSPLVSVIIPARNEKYLQSTIDDLLEKLQLDFEIIVGLDGYKPRLKKDPRVILCHSEERIGMRPIINKAVDMARGKYLMKLDAHCIVDKGIDTKLLRCHEPGNTVLAMRYELDSTNWKRRNKTDCPYRYLSHSFTDPKGLSLRSLAWEEYAEAHKDEEVGETMTISGSNWFMERDQFLQWGGLDEEHGTFGQEGAEISCKTWLSGGKVLVNKKTWYAHWNRGKSSYSLGANQKPKSYKRSVELWMGDKWPLAKRKFQWLVDHFAPVPGWNNTTIIFYTNNLLHKGILKYCLNNLKQTGLPLVTVSHKPLKEGDNIVVDMPTGYLSMFKQILLGAKKAQTKYVALAEHDVLYHPEHFNFVPFKDDVFYYNTNRWRFHLDDGVFSSKGECALSQLICNRDLLIEALEKRIKVYEKADIEYKTFIVDGKGYKLKSEPGNEEYPDFRDAKLEYFTTKYPSVDICHTNNLTGGKPKSNTRKNSLPYWGDGRKLIHDLTGVDYYRMQICKCAEYDVDEFYNNYVNHTDPNKRGIDNPRGVYEFQKTFRPFIDNVLAGTKYTDEELKQLPYYGYLAKHIKKLPDYTNLQLDDKGVSHVLRKMRDAENLCNSIKNDGLTTPLDVYKYDGEIILQRGQRRVVILKGLSIETFPARLFKDRKMFYSHRRILSVRGNGKIEKAAIKQFTKNQLASTDKYWRHNYTHLYDRHVPNRVKRVLEIGVHRGYSLLLWKDVFPKAKIFGIDINPSSKNVVKKNKNITVFNGNQSDREFIEKVSTNGPFDLIIDDASHHPRDIMRSLRFLWSHLSKNGIYVIEDMWISIKGKSRRKKLMDKLKSMIDGIYFNKTGAISFYPNICFIQKNG